MAAQKITVDKIMSRIADLEANLSVVLQRTQSQPRQSLEEMSSEHFIGIRDRDNRSIVNRRVAYLKRLKQATQTLTEQCPCGKHHGIAFTIGEEVILENLCPSVWYRSLTFLAFVDKDRKFLKDNPMPAFLSWYTL